MQTLTAKDVMYPEVIGVRVDMTAREAAAFLTDNQITGAPVLDGNGHLVGVVSLTDLAGNEVDVHEEDALVRDVMTPTVYTVPDDTPVAEIARAMIAGRIHRLFVTRKHRVVGIVTPLDLLKLLADESPAADASAVALAVPSAIRAQAGRVVPLARPPRHKAGRGTAPVRAHGRRT